MTLFDRMMDSVKIKYLVGFGYAKTDDIKIFLGEQQSKVDRLQKEISDLKADKSHSKSGQYIDVTFKVPVECIEVINARVIDGMAEFESIIVENCDFEIDQNSYDDSLIDQLAAERG